MDRLPLVELELARDRLAPGGAVIINVGHPEDSPRLEQVLTATMGAAFPHVVRDPVRDTNTLLMGSLEPPSPERLEAAAERMPPELREVALEDAARLAPPLRGGRVFTDDKAPVEWLVDASLVQAAADGR